MDHAILFVGPSKSANVAAASSAARHRADCHGGDVIRERAAHGVAWHRIRLLGEEEGRRANDVIYLPDVDAVHAAALPVLGRRVGRGETAFVLTARSTLRLPASLLRKCDVVRTEEYGSPRGR